LDEYIIRDLIIQGASINSFGVGENLITAKSDPVFGCVYKLAAVEREGELKPVIKISESVGKITIPDFKTFYRFYSKENGKAVADYITLYDEEAPNTEEEIEIFDPQATWKKKTLTNVVAKQMLVPIFEKGKCVYECPSIQEIRKYCAEQVDTLWEEMKRFEYPHKYYVDLSPKLWKIQNDLLTEMNGKW
ncbi:MAG: nicotinate phosphoribosyltransferase, partial [Oscillospiraceae bacterium]|nr:nicotinate phosphoribosyltransferase [Oscillospiraceae bacterium]